MRPCTLLAGKLLFRRREKPSVGNFPDGRKYCKFMNVDRTCLYSRIHSKLSWNMDHDSTTVGQKRLNFASNSKWNCSEFRKRLSLPILPFCMFDHWPEINRVAREQRHLLRSFSINRATFLVRVAFTSSFLHDDGKLLQFIVPLVAIINERVLRGKS